MGTKKNFILDTNVILHDYKCLQNFQENDIYLPIVVLEELDKFKKGNEQINYNAREFVRQLDSISGEDLFTKGTSLGDGMGKLYIIVSNEYAPEVQAAFGAKTPDHRILSDTMYVAAKHPKMKTILVSKDINLRMKAKALNIAAENYTNDTVKQIDQFENAEKTYENIDQNIIDAIYKKAEGIDPQALGLEEELTFNQCFILSSGHSTAMARYHGSDERVHLVKKQKCFGIEPRNAEQTFAIEVLTDPNVQLVAITGKAGTGKTLLALAAALQQHQEYKQILLARPIVTLSNKEMGFLPGDEKQKIAPYMQPLFDNLSVIKRQFGLNDKDYRVIQEMQESGQLEIEALPYIRGRSLSQTYCIVDEAQNLTPHEIKTIITRAGEGSKMIFTGDLQQIDSPYLDSSSNGLAYCVDKMRGQKLFAHINLIKGERSELSELASNLL